MEDRKTERRLLLAGEFSPKRCMLRKKRHFGVFARHQKAY